MSGGSLSLASMIVHEAALLTACRRLTGAGSTLRLADVGVAEYRSDDTCGHANLVQCRDGAVGAGLMAGDALSWIADYADQGSVGYRDGRGNPTDNGCAAKGTCGAPYSYDGLGGGWQLCFA